MTRFSGKMRPGKRGQRMRPLLHCVSFPFLSIPHGHFLLLAFRFYSCRAQACEWLMCNLSSWRKERKRVTFLSFSKAFKVGIAADRKLIYHTSESLASNTRPTITRPLQVSHLYTAPLFYSNKMERLLKTSRHLLYEKSPWGFR